MSELDLEAKALASAMQGHPPPTVPPLVEKSARLICIALGHEPDREKHWNTRRGKEGAGEKINIYYEWMNYILPATAVLEAAEADKARLIEALEWYGDQENWEPVVMGTFSPKTYDPYAVEDGGERARQVVAEVKGEG